MNSLSFEELLELHEASLALYGGGSGYYPDKEGTIRFALEQPFMGFGDVDTYPSIEEKAAAICFSLAMGHCFVDGNKRIGFLAMFVFLEKNGYTLTAENEEVVDFMLALADNRATREDLVAWVRKHIATLHDPLENENAIFGALVGFLGLYQSLLVQQDILSVLMSNFKSRGEEIDRFKDSPPRSRVKAAKQVNDVLFHMGKSLDFAATRFSHEIKETKKHIDTIETYAPFISDSFDVNNAEEREVLSTIIKSLEDSLSEHDKAIANIDQFKEVMKSVEDLDEISGAFDVSFVKASCEKMHGVLDEMTGIYNQDWFAWQDMIAGAKVALNE